MPRNEIYYSDKYTDDKFEYRHVMLPKALNINIDRWSVRTSRTSNYLNELEGPFYSLSLNL